MSSEIKRFISYLRDSSARVHDRSGSEDAVRPAHAGDVDFTEITSLLSKYKDDDRIRNVLMDPSDDKLQVALDDVLQELKEVEGVSIAAYIEEAEPLNVLHGQVCFDLFDISMIWRLYDAKVLQGKQKTWS